jgi:hypothetical protein
LRQHADQPDEVDHVEIELPAHEEIAQCGHHDDIVLEAEGIGVRAVMVHPIREPPPRPPSSTWPPPAT